MTKATRSLIAAAFWILATVGCGGGNDSTPDSADSKSDAATKSDKKTESSSDQAPRKEKTLGSGVSNQALTSTDALKHVEAALAALGGPERIAASLIGSITSQIDGVFHYELSGKFQRTDMFHLPGRLRRVIKGKSVGETLEMGYVLNGDVQWMQIANGPPMDVTGLDLRRAVDGMNVLWLLDDLHKRWDDVTDVAGTANNKTIQLNGKHPELGQFRLVITAKFKLPALLCLGEDCWTFGAYQKINELQIPMSVIHSVSGKQKYEVKIDKVQFFSTARPELFELPARK